MYSKKRSKIVANKITLQLEDTNSPSTKSISPSQEIVQRNGKDRHPIASNLYFANTYFTATQFSDTVRPIQWSRYYSRVSREKDELSDEYLRRPR